MPDARISASILGLGCGGGGALQLERALARLHGVETVYVNPATETAYITCDRRAIAIDALLDEVRSAGYRPGPVAGLSERGHALESRGSRMPPLILVAALGVFAVAHPLVAQEPSAHDVVDRAEKALWGSTIQGQLTMTVTTPRWERTLELESWMERPRRTFIRILAPAKEAGIASLRIGSEMWNYLPTVERTIRIPPSMMLQPWMGSDFSNDDLVKESSMVDDYTHRFLGTDTTGGVAVYVIEALPRPDAAVVWGRLVLRVRKADFLPVRFEYYDERGTLIRVLKYSDIRPIGGRSVPTRWEMRPTAKPGNVTTIVLKRATFNAPIPADIFTQRNLTRR